MEELKLIHLAQEGSKDAFNALVNLYANKLYQFLLLKCKNDADLEDVLQETFIRVYQKLHQFKPEHKFSTWLYTIAYHELIRYCKKKKSLTSLSVSEEIVASAKDVLEEEESAKNLWTIAAKLEQKQYTALWLYYKEDKSYQEIASILGISVVRLKLVLFRAKSSMKKLLELADKEGVAKNNVSVLFGV